MSKLSDLIVIRPSAEPYINFEKSLKNEAVCSGFVPVQSTLEVFGFLGEATATHAGSRAAICYGTYGSGKSRLCVVLARLFSEGFDAPALAPIWDQMDKRGWGDYLTKLRDVMCPGGRRWQPWLVVPMYGAAGGSTLDNALLHSLIRAVRERELPDSVLGITIFEAAARRLEYMITEGRTYTPAPNTPYPTAEVLVRSLREDASQDALDFFKEWHKRETAGVTLESAIKDQPDLCGSAAELYAHVADAVTAYGYEGVAVIWDEFGFAIEELLRGGAHGQRSLGQEAMDLQNFIEHACTGGILNGKVVFLGFTHVSLAEYGTRAMLQEQDRNRLAVVSGRFRQPDIPIRLSVTEAEGYHLLGGMKELTPEGSEVLARDFPCMRALAKRMPEFALWERFSPEQCYSDIIKTAYPLHPAAASVLLMLSDRIAQVNRTAFYFMHDRGNGGVAGQLEVSELPEDAKIGSTELIRVPDMFRFFEQAIQDHDSETYHKYEEALRRFPEHSEMEEAVIRTVLILKVANASPTTGMLAFCLCDATSEDREAAELKSALDRCVAADALWRNEATAVWDFARFSVDVEEPIAEEMAAIPLQDPASLLRTESAIQEELAEYLGTFDMEPTESGIVRRVRVEVLDMRNGKDGIKPVNPAVKNPSEGWCSAAIYMVVAGTKEIISHWRGLVTQLEPSCSYFLIPQTPVVLSSDIRRLLAITRVIDKGNLDKSRREILDAMFTALRGRLRREFAHYFGSEGFKSGACLIVKAGSTVTIPGISCWNDLFQRVTDDASHQFKAEVKVRCGSYNEWQDGQHLAPIEKIAEHLLSFADTGAYQTAYLGFKDTSQEAAVVDGVLVENNYLTEDIHGKWVLSPIADSEDGSLTDPVRAIREHFTRGGGGEKPFTKLFAQLIEPPFGIPNGIIPILSAVAMRGDMDRLALYVRKGSNSERISKTDLPKHLAQLARSPERYTSRFEQLAGKNRTAFKAMAYALVMSFSPRQMSGEPFYERCRDIRKTLGDWAKGRQELEVSSSAITEAQRELIKSLRGPIPPQLPELAEAVVKALCEDKDCEAELRDAGPATLEFPCTMAHWQRLADALGRITSGARAPVEAAIDRVTDGGKLSLGDVLRPLVGAEGGSFSKSVKELVDKKPEGKEEMIEILTGKDSSKLGEEDYGRMKGIFDVVEQLAACKGELNLMLPSRMVSLPPVADERAKSALESVVKDLRDGLGLSPEHIARVALDLLFPEAADSHPPAESGSADR